MSAGWGIKVSRSALTGHWIVNHGTRSAEGFRNWSDAMDEANRRADVHREYCQRQAEWVPAAGDEQGQAR